MSASPTCQKPNQHISGLYTDLLFLIHLASDSRRRACPQVSLLPVEMLLSAIYERDFYDFSHVFRKGRSQHKALHELREQCQ